MEYDKQVISRYSTQQVTAEDEAAVLAALRSSHLTQGPYVQRFEEALAEYVGARYAVACSNGTVGLWLAYEAAGVKLVVTSPLTFLATANAALLAGAVVDFSDVAPETGNLRPTKNGGYITTGKWNDLDVIPFIAPVHFAGRACEVPSGWERWAIEDACHALGATDFDGCSKVGSCAHSLATVFSFHPVKPITTGEGGAVTTNDEGFAQVLRSLRDHGREAGPSSSGLMTRLGTNGRMDELSAALGLSQLKRCDEMRKIRAQLADLYCQLLHTSGLEVNQVTVEGCCETVDDHSLDHCKHSHHLYPIRIKHGRRGEVKAKLNAAGIGAQVHYSPPVHLHPYYRQRFGYKEGDFPEAEAWAREELSLPLHVGMTDEDVETVVAALREALT